MFDHTQVAVHYLGRSQVIFSFARKLLWGIWCSWLSHPLSMVLSAGGLRFESGFVHIYFPLFLPPKA